MARFWKFTSVLPLLGLLTALPASAQWAGQTLTLNPGWNAVFLEVQPEPDDTVEVFKDMPVESVWTWNKQFETVQYIQDPSTLIPEQPEWLKYFAGNSPGVLNSLNIIAGGRAYLIKLGGTQPVEWNPVGIPIYRPMDWQADSFNFTGFYTGGTAPDTFASYFAPSSAHAGQKIHQLNPAGQWVEIPASTSIQRGAAYWVYTAGQSEYRGPVHVDLEDNNGLDYGRALDERDIELVNTTATPRVVRIDKLASSTAPAGTPQLAGEVEISWLQMDLANKVMEWMPLTGEVNFTVPAQDTLRIRVAVRRADFAAFVPVVATDDFLYQSVLRVRDDAGTLIRVPVTANGLQNLIEPAPGSSPASKQTGLEAFAHPHAGLWFGYVSINGVSEPRNASAPVGPFEPQQTNSEFVFPIIIHVTDEGDATLLQHVTVMWKDGTTRPDPADPELQVLDQPGRYVLVSDDSLLDQFQGAVTRDGAQVGKRISSANFSNRTPLALAGEFGQNLSAQLNIAHNDPLNPFKHAFHPDHDMSFSQPTTRSDGSQAEMYTITRQIDIQFSATDTEGNDTVRWGDQLMGGTYNESIIGIHKQIINVRGPVRLSKVADVGVLNDGIQ